MAYTQLQAETHKEAFFRRAKISSDQHLYSCK